MPKRLRAGLRTDPLWRISSDDFRFHLAFPPTWAGYGSRLEGLIAHAPSLAQAESQPREEATPKKPESYHGFGFRVQGLGFRVSSH